MVMSTNQHSSSAIEIMVGDLDEAAIWHRTLGVVMQLVGDECEAQGVTQEVFEEVVRSCTRLGEYLADAREELGAEATVAEFIEDTLARSHMFADDVLARTVAGKMRRHNAHSRSERECARYLENHGEDAYQSPATVYAQFRHLAPEVSRYLLMCAWIWGQPTKLPQRKWRSMFERAGFTIDGQVEQRPDSVPTLYRAALPGHERNWSWTDSLAVARWFQERVDGSDIYVLDGGVSPEAVLARFDSLAENEWVVDVAAAGVTPMRLAA